MSFEIKGVRELERKLERIGANALRAVAPAMEIEAELIMTDSKENYAPVAPKGGALRASGIVAPAEIKNGNVSVTMGYGGPSGGRKSEDGEDLAGYAEAIHEHPSGASPPSWKGKTLNFHLGGDRRKYLERPLMQAKAGLAGRLARRIRVEDWA